MGLLKFVKSERISKKKKEGKRKKDSSNLNINPEQGQRSWCLMDYSYNMSKQVSGVFIVEPRSCIEMDFRLIILPGRR